MLNVPGAVTYGTKPELLKSTTLIPGRYRIAPVLGGSGASAVLEAWIGAVRVLTFNSEAIDPAPVNQQTLVLSDIAKLDFYLMSTDEDAAAVCDGITIYQI